MLSSEKCVETEGGVEMRLAAWLEDVQQAATWETLGSVRSVIGVQWVREALSRTGTATIRRRKIPNEAVVWLVIGIALFRQLAIDAVLKHLGLSIPRRASGASPTGSPVSSDAIAHARARVGLDPLSELFDLTGHAWVAEFDQTNRWKGLGLFALDGSTLRVADTAANEEVYGRPGSSRAPAAYPQARIVTFIAVRSRLVPNFVVGTLDQGEQTLAQMLFPGLPDHSLTLLDRGFVNYASFARIPRSGTERHYLCRGKANLRMKLVGSLGKDDSLVEVRVPDRQRKEDPTLPETLILRKLNYQIKGFLPSTLLTSLLDCELYPAKELIQLYHKRWEIELSYDEIKTDTLEQKESLRSKNPDLVLQEIYGLLIAYNLVRVMMARAARDAGVEPCRMSFRNSLVHVRYFLVIAAVVAPANLPRLYRKLAVDLALLVLPPRRTRRYPRTVKIKMTSYKRKPVE
jgi:hypothetical protein